MTYINQGFLAIFKQETTSIGEVLAINNNWLNSSRGTRGRPKNDLTVLVRRL